ncbi:hypothetical protein [uncultured Eubacterium sp.]|uniref:hypothetical protein n=1 Tax=uncultured Eubacterium sp. TaxID=165185 RepID=UPI0025984954|nr:hypothetical protein [uncultured Eubacterium sp.]
MIFVVRPDSVRDEASLKELQERLAAEINSDRDGKVVVIPADCEYDVITGESEMITKVRSMLE